MDTFLTEKNPERKGINKTLLAALAIAAIVVIAVIGIISLKPSMQEVEKQALEGAYREGTPEFAAYTKKIAAETDENRTTQSPTGLGTVVMSIGGNIRNITGKTLTGLELKVGVVDSFGKILKEKTLIVIPKQAERLDNNQTLPVQVLVEGFSKEDDRANIRWKVTAIKVE